MFKQLLLYNMVKTFVNKFYEKFLTHVKNGYFSTFLGYFLYSFIAILAAL